MFWRQMHIGDAPGVADLANTIHLSYPEDPAVIHDRLSVYPEGCYLLDDGGDPRGYLVCHPWLLRALPALNSRLGSLPERPDCFYLHDLALDESVRGQGHALTAVEIVLGRARACGLSTILLMAVGNAHAFWEHVGFRRYDSYEEDPSKGYGSEAASYILELEM
jgi:GNAT superfamily N-acetyltransferase